MSLGANNADGESYDALEEGRFRKISQTGKKLNITSEITTDINQANQGVKEGEPN